jgi:hypothetical protein
MKSYLAHKAYSGAIAINIFLLFFSGLLLDNGTLSTPLGFSASVLLVYLTIKYISNKKYNVEINREKVLIIITSPITLNAVGIFIANLVRSLKA